MNDILVANPKSPISQAMTNIFNRLDKMDETVVGLRAKLQPVLSQEPSPSPGNEMTCADGPQDPSSDLTRNLEEVATRIRLIEIRLIELMDRVEL